MSSIEHRRRAWAALNLGPLWRPIAGALPHGPLPLAEAAIGQASDAVSSEPTPEGNGPEWESPESAGEGFGTATDGTGSGYATESAGPASEGMEPAGEGPESTGEDIESAPERCARESGPSPVEEASMPENVLWLSAKSGLSEAERWQQLRRAVSDCRGCGLADSRQNTVFGRGQAGRVRWMLIGEAPGAEEDRQGEAFVGQAGRLLDAMLLAAGIDPARDVFIANVLKCRPPGNRNPEQEEVAKCQSFLHEQIRLASPDCILLLGRFAAQSVLNSTLAISRLRNKVHHISLAGRQVPVICTFHPAYLLRSPLDKAKSWEDLCLARSVVAETA